MGASPRRAAGPLPESDDFDIWDDLSEDWVGTATHAAPPAPSRAFEPEDPEDSERNFTSASADPWAGSTWTDDPWADTPAPTRALARSIGEQDLFSDPFDDPIDEPRPSRAWVDDEWDSPAAQAQELEPAAKAQELEPAAKAQESQPAAHTQESEPAAHSQESEPAAPDHPEGTDDTNEDDEPRPSRAWLDDDADPDVEPPTPLTPLTPLTPRSSTGRRLARRSAREGLLNRHGRTAAIVGGVVALTTAGSLLLPGFLPRLQAIPAATAHAVAGASATAAPTPEAARAAADRPARGGDRPEAAPTPTESPRPTAVAKPVAAMTVTNVAGIPRPCEIDLPITDDMSAAQITAAAERQWGFDLTGPQWQQNEYRPIVELFAETLDSVDCTDYLSRVKAGNGGRLEISSLSTNSWAWGDYGLTRPNVLTLDFAKFRTGYADGDRGRLVRLIIHEMAHSLNADRGSQPAYWNSYLRVWGASGPVSAYGTTDTESFADAVGYYVARCAADNPYDSTKNRAYYDYVKANIFGGREFGGAVGTPQTCAIKGR